MTNATGQISQWLDQSGNGNNATQANSSQQPLLVNPAAINGLGAVRFDGNPSASLGDYLQGNGDVGLSNAYTSFLVYQLSSASNVKQVPSIVGIGTASGNSRAYFIYNQEMRFGAYNYDFGNGFIIPLNTYRIATHRLSTNESVFEQFDATATTSNAFSLTPSGLVVPPPGYTVGSLPSQAMSFAGDIAELIYYRGSLSEADRLAVQQYLQQKYYGVAAAGSSFSYQWQFDGADLPGATNSSLVITNVQFANAGTYDLVVTNFAGATTSSNATLTVVAYPPSIITQPANQIAISGGSANFSISATGTAPLSYFWMRGGVPIAGATSSSYSTNNVQLADSGAQFSCLVSNAYGTILSSNALLTVLNVSGVAGYFTDNNTGDTGPQGPITHVGLIALQITNISTFSLNSIGILFIDESSVGISSALQGRLAEIQTWTSNGGKLIVHDRGPAAVSPNPFLLGTGITPAAYFSTNLDLISPTNNLVVAGPYGTINNTNLDGGNYSAHGYVLASQLPANATAFISIGGAPSNVVCFSYSLGQGMVYYSDIPLDCYLGANTCSGNVIAATLQNIYTPNVLAYVASFSVCSNCPPTINSQPTNQVVLIGGTAAFTVSATGPQSLGYQWQNNGSPISGATNTAYSITNVQFSDAATYSVVVSNAFGSVTSSNAVLAINTTPPSITTQPISLTVQAGSSATFSVSAAGAPPFSYRWQKNSNDIAGATLSGFTITNAQPTDAGTYSVVVTNLYGTATSSNATLTVLTSPPSIVTQPASRTVSIGATVNFSVNATGTAPLTYSWQHDGVPIGGASNASFSITNAQMSNTGSYSVIVTNSFGSITSSNAALSLLEMDHFSWSTISSPQQASSAFAVTISARDSAGALYTDFSSVVDLSAVVNLGGTIENFDSGIWPHSPWITNTAVPGTVAATNAHDGAYGLSDPGWAYRTDVQV
ncbi:MAG: immunoglobulin domain-containing protein, partial [Limisphaerales bacterium]